MSIIEEFPAIYGLEDTKKMEKIGKWFFITESDQLKEARKFIHKDIKKAYYKLDIGNLARFQYPDFPHL